MQFLTLREYFYKVQNFLYLFVIIPLGAFILVYVRMRESLPVLTDKQQTDLVLILFVVVALSEWVVAALLFNRKVKSIRPEPGLRMRLELYARATIIRFGLISSSCLLLAIGFFLTGNELFSLVLVLNLVVQFFIWPFSKKVCRDLQLKGSEREMILYKKDTL